jgi:hypothetical protein
MAGSNKNSSNVSKPASAGNDFARQAEEAPPGLLAELWVRSSSSAEQASRRSSIR